MPYWPGLQLVVTLAERHWQIGPAIEFDSGLYLQLPPKESLEVLPLQVFQVLMSRLRWRQMCQ